MTKEEEARRVLSATSAARALLLTCCLTPTLVGAQTFRLSYATSASAGPITGRAFVFIARTDRVEPRFSGIQSASPGIIVIVTKEYRSPGKS